jgi:tetratricopeptide (TPR) repeat protein
MVSPKEAYPLAKSAATKALQIDDRLAEAHWAMATVKMDFERDWSGAELEFKRAFAIDPTSVDAHHRYAHLLEALKRPQESLAETERALEIDPLDPLLNAHLGWHYLSVGEFDRAVAQCHKALDIGETYFGHFYLGRTYEQLGRYEEAVAELTRAHAMAKGDTEGMAAIGYVYAVSGKRRDAQRVIEDLDSVVDTALCLARLQGAHLCRPRQDRAGFRVVTAGVRRRV